MLNKIKWSLTVNKLQKELFDSLTEMKVGDSIEFLYGEIYITKLNDGDFKVNERYCGTFANAFAVASHIIGDRDGM